MRERDTYQRGMIAVMLFILILFSGSSCVPVEEKVYSLDKNINDSTVAQLLVYQNEQLTDSLKKYFNHPNPTCRYYVARAFQSYSEDSVIDSLIKLLDDKEYEVVNAAAYALGQSKNKRALTSLIEHFDNNDSLGKKNKLNSTILEAVGKLGGADELELFTSIKTFLPRDSSLYMGLLRGILQFQLNEIYSDEADELVEDILVNINYPETVRLLACEIALRSRKKTIDAGLVTFKRLIENSRKPDLKLAYIKLLKRLRNSNTQVYLHSLVTESTDIAVRATALQTLASYPFSSIKELMDRYIDSENPQLQEIALQTILLKSSEEDAFAYQKMLDKVVNPFAQAKLYGIVMKKLPFYYAVTKRTMRNQIADEFRKSQDNYLKASLIEALAQDVFNYDILVEEGLDHENPVVRTAAAKGLIAILSSENLDKQFRSQADKIKKEIYGAFQKAIRERADDGLIYELLVADKGVELKKIKQELLDAREKLKLPESWEAYLTICEKLDCDAPDKDRFYRKVSVDDIRNMKDTIQVEISMSFGEMLVELYPEVAPFTVLAFLDLVEKNYYDGKFIHRVVPQFVIQDGCPRGDGYGGLDFMLRTETPQVYYDRGGLLGMASAGRDTESAQWFITYKNTPHLNGRYTIFGQVVSGIDNVQYASVGAKVNFIKIKE